MAEETKEIYTYGNGKQLLEQKKISKKERMCDCIHVFNRELSEKTSTYFRLRAIIHNSTIEEEIVDVLDKLANANFEDLLGILS